MQCCEYVVGWGMFIWFFNLGSRRCKCVYKMYLLVEVQEGWGGGDYRGGVLSLILSSGKYVELLFGVSGLRIVDGVSSVYMGPGTIGIGGMVLGVRRVA